MKLFFHVIFLLVLAAGAGCRSSRGTKETPPAETQSQTPPGSPASSPTVVAQNISNIEAVVEELQDFGATQFNLKIFVISSNPVNGRVSVVEAGQRIFVTPQYYADSTGKVNFEEARNKRLMSLKLLKTGQAFKGKIAINRQGSWNIVDVDESK